MRKMDKNQYNSKFFKVYEDFLNCKEMRELIHTSQIGMAGWFFLSVLTMHTARTDGILYKFDDDERLVPLTNKDISNWFIGMTDFDEETVGMYINLLILKKLLYTNKFGCLTITNYCYTDDNEPSLHSINDPSAKLKIFGVWENDRRIERWKTKYKAILEKSGQSNLLEIEMDYSPYIQMAELQKQLNISRATFYRYIKLFQSEYSDAVITSNNKNKLFKKEYITLFKTKYNISGIANIKEKNAEKSLENKVRQNETTSETNMRQSVRQFPNNFDSSENPHKYAEIESETISETISTDVRQCETTVRQTLYIDNKDNIDINNIYIYIHQIQQKKMFPSFLNEMMNIYLNKKKSGLENFGNCIQEKLKKRNAMNYSRK